MNGGFREHRQMMFSQTNRAILEGKDKTIFHMISLNAINAKCKLDPIVIYPTPLIIIEFKCAIYLQNAGKKNRFDFDVFFSAKYV